MERTVMLTDTAKVGYLVDESIEHLLRTKHVWTRDDGTLMVRIRALHIDCMEEMSVAQFVWESWMMQSLSPNAEIRCKRGPRDVCFVNLEAVPKRTERSA